MMNKVTKLLGTQIKMGYWPGFIVGMYPSQFAYKPMQVDFKKAWSGVDEINLYVHIPFCKWSCSFCTFFKVIENDKAVFEKYVDKLIEQIEFYDNLMEGPVKIKSICFGGGTPNAIPAESYIKIFKALDNSNFYYDDCLEPSIEISPENITSDYLRILKQAGLKRISMGVQSLREELRRDIGRGRNLNMYEIVSVCRDLGLNINIDVINGIRNQNGDDFMTTLKELMKFEPETISTYILSGVDNGLISKDSRFMTTKEKYEVFDEFYDHLTANGYDCESHVKFVKSEQSSTHQQKIYEYEGTPTLGIGCGGRSYAPTVHYGNPWYQDRAEANQLIQDYIQKDFSKLEWEGFYMSTEELKRRHIIYAFFMGHLSLEKYTNTFGSTFQGDFPNEYEALVQLKLVTFQNETIILTKKGRKYTDLIGVTFWSDPINKLFNTKSPNDGNCKDATQIPVVEI